MTEIEKLDVGLEYCYDDPAVVAREEKAKRKLQKQAQNNEMRSVS